MEPQTRSASGATARPSDGDPGGTSDPLEQLIATVRRERRPGEPLEQVMRKVWLRERGRLDWATITAFRSVGEAVLGPDAAIASCPTAQGGYLAFVGFLVVAGRRIDPAG